MKITEIRIHLMGEDRLKAFASATLDDSFVVRNMKVVEGTKGVFRPSLLAGLRKII